MQCWEAMRGVGDRAHLMLPASHPDLPWTGILVGMVSTNLWYYATNQYINQRVLGARNEWHARAGVIFAGFLGLFLALSWAGLWMVLPPLARAIGVVVFALLTLAIN